MTDDMTTRNGFTFEYWLRRVDAFITSTCGLGLDDLADAPTWDMWNDEMSWADAARKILRDEGYRG